MACLILRPLLCAVGLSTLAGEELLSAQLVFHGKRGVGGGEPSFQVQFCSGSLVFIKGCLLWKTYGENVPIGVLLKDTDLFLGYLCSSSLPETMTLNSVVQVLLKAQLLEIKLLEDYWKMINFSSSPKFIPRSNQTIKEICTWTTFFFFFGLL